MAGVRMKMVAMDHLLVSEGTLSKEDSDSDGWGEYEDGGGGGSPVSIRRNLK